MSKEYYDKYINKGYNITLFKQDKPNHNASSGIRYQIKIIKTMARKFDLKLFNFKKCYLSLYYVSHLCVMVLY